MDRRHFLELLGAVGALVGGAKFVPTALARDLNLATNVNYDEWLPAPNLAVQGRESKLLEVAFINNTTGIVVPELTTFDGKPLLQLLVAPQGAVKWVASSGFEFIGPVQIVLPQGVSGFITGTDRLGRVVRASNTGHLNYLTP